MGIDETIFDSHCIIKIMAEGVVVQKNKNNIRVCWTLQNAKALAYYSARAVKCRITLKCKSRDEK